MAVEESSAAVADARENAAGLDNVEFLLGKTEDVLLKLPHRPDVVVLDPSRSGCRPAALENLIQLAPARVAYVSCDAETLARDLKVLCESAYTLKEVVPLDMFPQTHHVECVALLDLAARPGGLVLASASPRRRELLAEMGLEFQIVPSDVPEEPKPGEPAGEVVRRLSADKALAVSANVGQGLVIGADSMVVLEGQVIGKPSDAAEARLMLLRLRGTRHQVATGITVVDAASGRYLSDSMFSNITLRDLSDEEIDASIASGTPLDKAGAYAVQDADLRPAQSWDGCYSNIVGLPLCRLGEMLVELGYTLPPDWPEKASQVCGDSCPRGIRQSRERGDAMNLMGMGLPEMAVVLLIAFLVLGPGKSIDMARSVGKIVGELRRTFSDLAAAVTLEEGQERGSPPAGPQPQADADPGSADPASKDD